MKPYSYVETIVNPGIAAPKHLIGAPNEVIQKALISMEPDLKIINLVMVDFFRLKEKINTQ